ncbi:MAG: adenine specific methylase Mod [Nocardioides sp.]|nr:adenine specific methylase Mod [Nocardioides sp.]
MISEQPGAQQQPDAPTFEQSILDNLARAGVQNGRRDERIEVASTESYPGTFIQARGHRMAAVRCQSRRRTPTRPN